ncbi:zinc finger and SCAN domain-containing protein 2 [Phlebotomus argentipes]|uniref:zinc finger and SCAN domain-containing protein 2 n=1 Tax=Phlebotomus argentipes TaxID=94469 RepID=UPI0028935AE3|nr:zinc finger and SCAN domain-containing protein 2 [Phlebotomus argentipes]
MVHEIEPLIVPDELYNLTQLAEVSLAAGKLSTTSLQANFYVNDNRKETTSYKFPIYRHNSTESFSQTDSDDSYGINQWRSRSIDSSAIPFTQHSTEARAQSDPSASHPDSHSQYKYSHKIFDKRKLRKLSDHVGTDIETNSQSSDGSTDGNLIGTIKSECQEPEAEDIHVCPECGKKYSTSSNLARHRQTHRSLEDKKARRCPHCDKVYVSMPAFSMHVRTHNQGCECPHCGKCFSRPWLLQGHIRTHTGEKPFKCTVCTKAFADKSNLRAHIQTHSNTKPHSCSRCGKSFALKSYLYKHEESSCMRNHQKSDKSKVRQNGENNSSSIIIFKLEKKQQNKEKRAKIFANVTKTNATLSREKSKDSCSRISVIQSLSKTSDDAHYQEQPVDFSARKN